MGVAAVVAIDLLRHGETVRAGAFCGRTDVPLSKHGWAQMWAATSDRHWATVVSSPLRRCADFARALARRCAVPLRLDERWREMDFGEWENRTATELLANDPQRLAAFWDDPWHHPPPGGERLAAVQARVLAAWTQIVAERQPTLIVTHGGPMRVIHCHRTRHPIKRLLDLPLPYAARRRLQTPNTENGA
jgi:alpha-ribazole phosphatase